jgi:integrase
VASTKKRPDGRWLVRYRDPDRREHVKTFDRKVDADNFAKTTDADMLRGDYIDPRAGRVPFKQRADRWLAKETPRLKPSTAVGYASLLRSRVNPRFGATPIAAIRASDVQEWLNSMSAEGLSASRVRKCAIVMKLVLDDAVLDNLIRANPVTSVKPPSIERHEAAYFAPEVVDAIAAAMPTPEYALLIQVLGVCRLRFGEAVALSRDRVDVARRRLLIRESTTELGGGLVRTAPKSHRHRQVPLPPALAASLATHLGERVGPGDDAAVFRAPQGGPLRYRAFHARVWAPTLQSLGLPHAGLHALRHSAAARMIQAGATPKAVQTILGHRSVSFTLDTYGHVFDSDLDDLAAKLDADFSRTPPVSLEQRRAARTG